MQPLAESRRDATKNKQIRTFAQGLAGDNKIDLYHVFDCQVNSYIIQTQTCIFQRLLSNIRCDGFFIIYSLRDSGITMSIVKIDTNNFEKVLPLIAAYQRFYEVADISEARNREFFSQFVASNERGILHGLNLDGAMVGFSTIYFCFSSALAKPVAVLNDLFVIPEQRGKGYGRALINHAAAYAGNLGIERLHWVTAQNNTVAQRTYDGMSAKKSAWFFYALETKQTED